MVSTLEYWKYGLWNYEGFVLLFYIFVSKKMIPSFEPLFYAYPYNIFVHIQRVETQNDSKPQSYSVAKVVTLFVVETVAFLFYLYFLSWTLMIHRTAGEGGSYLF